MTTINLTDEDLSMLEDVLMKQLILACNEREKKFILLLLVKINSL